MKKRFISFALVSLFISVLFSIGLIYANYVGYDVYANTVSPEQKEILQRTRVPILLYHHILPDDKNTTHRNNGAVVSLKDFEEQMNFLYSNGFNTIKLSQLEDFLYRDIPLPPKSVMVHFDDGYYSNFVYAYPILKRYGFTASLFLIGMVVYDRGEIQPPMNYEGITFTAAGTIVGTEDVFETASHTFTMHNFADDSEHTVLVLASKEEIIKDTLRSFDFVNDFRAFAYPRGQFNDIVIEALAEAGITLAFTVEPGYVTINTNPFEINRFIIFSDMRMSRFIEIVNGSV